jgi:hypothetical protein
MTLYTSSQGSPAGVPVTLLTNDLKVAKTSLLSLRKNKQGLSTLLEIHFMFGSSDKSPAEDNLREKEKRGKREALCAVARKNLFA